MTYEELIARIYSGDESAVEQLYLLNSALIRSIVYAVTTRNHVLTHGLLEDLEQEGALAFLQVIRSGRYRLLRTSDKGAGNKRGLELKVHDNRSPEKEGRSVSMLSGGEKFLVSLALSIGMSTVAQTTGVQIEALFIDEGFGTLDDKSIGDAMEVLEGVRRSSGTIGIISHVAVLEENIATQLEVVKTNEGSRIEML